MKEFKIKKPRNILGQNEIIGHIHSTESFGSVDGPGIRFVVFMQGCILNCKYCQNRDTWDFVEANRYTPTSLFDEIKKYETYYKTSNGGITFSGGDPLAQSKFVLEASKLLKSKGFHIAIDTSGFFPLNESIKEVIDIADLILLDIKHINNEKCKDLVGRENILNIEFLKYLEKIKKPTWIRQVILPGYTDDEKDLIDLKNFLKQFKCIENIELLPYNDFGKFKWEELNIPYPLEGVPNATNKDIKRAQKILNLKKNDKGYYYID